ncbi:MAG: carotenoid biosynthesis protein [Flavobacteriales bacterium]|nr:carotenoid biosynthesis protein [Flavobacteriales bacterium]
MKSRQNISIAVLIIFHGVGIGGILLGDPDQFLQLTPINLLLTLAIVLFNHVDWQRAWILWLTMGLGFLIEVMGVHTGFPFGTYSYGEVLGIKLWSTPLIIGVNWLILLYGANAMAKKFAMTPWAQALVAAGLMVVLDYLIEPVAIRFDLWSWEGGVPPLMNYMGWFGSALLLSLLWQYGKLRLNTTIATAVYATELIFFGVVNLIP